jgi:hypothetical protein
MFAALLDTSVLWPSLQRDFLLSLAIEGMYRPLWSSAILAELEYHETHKLIDRGEQADVAATRAYHLIDQMTAAFDDALVENWEPHDGAFGLPDPDDERDHADCHWDIEFTPAEAREFARAMVAAAELAEAWAANGAVTR